MHFQQIGIWWGPKARNISLFSRKGINTAWNKYQRYYMHSIPAKYQLKCWVTAHIHPSQVISYKIQLISIWSQLGTNTHWKSWGVFVQWLSSLTGTWQGYNAYNTFGIYFRLYLCPSYKIGICFGPSALIKSLYDRNALIKPRTSTPGIIYFLHYG